MNLVNPMQQMTLFQGNNSGRHDPGMGNTATVQWVGNMAPVQFSGYPQVPLSMPGAFPQMMGPGGVYNLPQQQMWQQNGMFPNSQYGATYQPNVFLYFHNSVFLFYNVFLY